MKTIALVGTFDSKGPEYAYVQKIIQGLNVNTLMIHVGVFEPTIKADISNKEVFAAANADMDAIVAKKDRAQATEALAKGVEVLLPKLYQEKRFDGVLSFGGSGGTSIATPGMRALPIGVPKIMVSTLASGNVAPYVGTSDILMMPSIVDVSGLNSISTKIFSNAAKAIVGMVNLEVDIKVEKKPLIAATMFGVTTPCVNTAKDYLEKQGYEVIVFHATGTGGKTMESLIESKFFDGVLDITTTEWCDELFGGVLNAGPNRLEAAGKMGIPQVVSVGALDMVNFGPYDSIPKHYEGRNFYKHNPTVTLMRTTVAENKALGEILAKKLNMSKGKTTLMLPLKGVSMIDAPEQPFYGKAEDEMLFETIRKHIDKNKVELVEMDNHINDDDFALAAAKKLVSYLKG